MKTQLIRSIATIAILFCTVELLFAQNGTIKGKVIDQNNSETVIGANINIQGTSNYATTNIDGIFEFKNAEPGSYIVNISYLGYQSAIIDTAVLADKETYLEILLLPESNQIDAVVITGRTNKQNEMALIAERKNAN